MNTVRTFVLVAVALTTIPAFAQRHDGGGSHGGGGVSHGAPGGGFHGTPGGSFHGGQGGYHRSGFPGGQSHGGQGAYRSGAGYHGGGDPWHGHLPSHRVYRPYHSTPIVNHYNTRLYNNAHIAVRPYRPFEWRRYHPNWHERYYYRGGRYFYDNAFVYPAVIDNEWGSIAALSGGVALVGALDGDPYLFFGGALGSLYSYNRYEDDLHSSNSRWRLRAAYFGRPYFWRGGVRYQRQMIYQSGHRYYRFRRH